MTSRAIDVYIQWFNAYIGDPSWEKHFDNIVLCLKEDLEQNVILKGSDDYFELKEHYVALKDQLSNPNFTKTDAVIDIALKTFEGARVLK